MSRVPVRDLIERAGASAPARPVPRDTVIPLPKEHGAWIMLTVPLLIGLSAGGEASLWEAALLIVAALSLFIARESLGLVVRGRGGAAARRALVLLASIGLAASAPLVVRLPRIVIAIAIPAAALLAVHTWLTSRKAPKRLDRTLAGELIGGFALTLTAPAGWGVAQHKLAPGAWLLWLGCALFFTSGVLHVRMWLAAAKQKPLWSPAAKRRLAAPVLAFHVVLGGAAVALGAGVGGLPGVLLAISVLPAVARGVIACWKLRPKLPKLKLVGMAEAGFTLWFAGAVAWAISQM